MYVALIQPALISQLPAELAQHVPLLHKYSLIRKATNRQEPPWGERANIAVHFC
jgi:hypothetical protein